MSKIWKITYKTTIIVDFFEKLLKTENSNLRDTSKPWVLCKLHEPILFHKNCTNKLKCGTESQGIFSNYLWDSPLSEISWWEP